MAQLKDTIIDGNLSVEGKISGGGLTPQILTLEDNQVIILYNDFMVTILIRMANKTYETLNGWNTLTTIPSELAPWYEIDFPVIDNAATSFESTGLNQARIYTDGRILLWSFSDHPTLQAYATVSYVRK